jgi:hypothetical protein
MTRLAATKKFRSELVAFVVANPKMTLPAIADLHGVSSSYISIVCKERGIARPSGKGSPAYKRITKIVTGHRVAKEVA